ncbi:MAG: type II secretion system GspH family protein [Synergistaceae bacterium]|jgi:prepilin-type N-terminal cleavage/methylation domain-containing protein|nr:type II secretion system GspH family protein [Synergistaceae bacterium]
MRILPTTTRDRDKDRHKNPARRRGRRHGGFTLIETVIVVAVIALSTVLVLPRRFFPVETAFRALQRAVLEISDLALDGYSIRLRLETVRENRGRVVTEALVRVNDAFDPAKYMIDWKPIQLRYPLEGENWRLEPEIVYFYSDGTCTPARILRADGGVRIENGDSALLTVTGFLFDEAKRRD